MTLGPHPIDTGSAELLQDLDRPNALTLLVNGVQSSSHDLDDPTWLEFEYLRWIETILLRLGAPAPDARWDVLHLGGGGCSLARTLAAVRPRSRHLAVEIDGVLAQLVRQWFPLPSAPTLRIRVGDARTVLDGLPDASRDAVVRDAFAGATVPASLTTVEYTEQVGRVLRPRGVSVANCTGVLSDIRDELATAAAVFEQVAVVGHDGTLRGRHPGNLLLIGTDRPLGAPEIAALRAELLRDPTPAHLWIDDQLAGVLAGGTARQDPPAENGPSC
ncbi:spermidine synthase [Nakamurella leprariae]|uniref:Fused MFS/spermidine synthase n=1 Tax=Nakamurella leprariae TaxID=2803911 RepID=A0A938YB81_9ACTN|nr:fused MFS/spermidine synthase [Nakamurella leprariae]MBM9469290.1 fused MFS/spermidine synthase [Nakamurella leprariae]